MAVVVADVDDDVAVVVAAVAAVDGDVAAVPIVPTCEDVHCPGQLDTVSAQVESPSAFHDKAAQDILVRTSKRKDRVDSMLILSHPKDCNAPANPAISRLIHQNLKTIKFN